MVLLKNTDKRQHAIYNCGYEMRVPRGKTVDIPGRHAFAMMRRWPALVMVDENGKEIDEPKPQHDYPAVRAKAVKQEAPDATVMVTATPEANKEEV